MRLSFGTVRNHRAGSTSFQLIFDSPGERLGKDRLGGHALSSEVQHTPFLGSIVPARLM